MNLKSLGLKGGHEKAGFGLILVVFVYTCFRAYWIPVNHDEALTFLYQIWQPKTFLEILTYKVPTANNHLLNTFWMKLAYSWFGVSEFAFRISSLLGLLLYAFGINRSLKLFLRGHRYFIALALCLGHPFFINHFSQAKGYPLAMGFLAWGFYFSLKRISQGGFQSHRNALYVCLSGFMFACSVLGNLAFLNAFVAISVLFLALELIQAWQKTRNPFRVLLQTIRNTILPLAPWGILLAAVYTGPITKLRAADQFYFGGNEGFWVNTVRSIIGITINYRPVEYSSILAERNMHVVEIVAAFLLVFLAIFLLTYLFQRRSTNQAVRVVFWTSSLMTMCFLSILLQHLLFDVLYVQGRAAMYFLPLFFMSMVGLWDCLAENTQRFKPVTLGIEFIFLGLTLPLLGYYALCANISEHYAQNGTDIREMVLDVEELRTQGTIPQNKVKIGARWGNSPMINFYIIKHKLNWANYVPRIPDFSTTRQRFDVYHIFEQDHGLIGQHNLELIQHYQRTDSHLAIPKMVQ